ncbi:nuclear transcription factor Y subunit gamma-like isoform X2 [Gordionus sp. m RMFG-2023]|uniref:nuclear transcription factor Y subunit gamma-like isoform X2 n=1 Tax=Gordionus sp. m RMFG-2023 TaxID=3053472 RepID=UPI0031FCCA08
MSEYSVLDPESQQKIHENFWEKQSKIVDNINMRDLHLRIQDLPLARIKKIMKLDENVKMISAEVPILFAKAAELFISEITMRGWWCTEENKRRTLQKSDIALAASRYDQFDFLIDIVPREEIKMSVKKVLPSMDSISDISKKIILHSIHLSITNPPSLKLLKYNIIFKFP